jgi:hypothetical protein
VRIGTTRVASKGGNSTTDGTITSFASPFFHVTFDNGTVKKFRGHVLAPLIRYRDDDFYDPAQWSGDYRLLQLYRIPGWTRACQAFLSKHGAFVPKSLLAPVTRPRTDVADAARTGSLERERTTLRLMLNELVDECRAKRTMDNLRNPILQLLHYAATRGLALPLSAVDFALYATSLALNRDNIGAVTRATNAASFLAEINGWPIVYSEGIAAAPANAMRRRHKHQVKKTAGLTLKMVERIMNKFGKARAGIETDKHLDFAFAAAVCIGFKLLLRYDDLRRCRWDKGFCEVFPTHIRFYLSGRKNNQYKGDILDVATPRRPTRHGIYHVAVRAQRLFKSGFVLPHVDGRSKTIDRSRCMSYETFVRALRAMLLRIGVPAARARKYAGHSMRCGGATAAAIGRLTPAEISHLAGVKDLNWLAYYDRKRLRSRLRASRAIGL